MRPAEAITFPTPAFLSTHQLHILHTQHCGHLSIQIDNHLITMQGSQLLHPWPSCPLPAQRAPCHKVRAAPRGRRPARVSLRAWGVCRGWAPSTTCSLGCTSRSWGQPLGSTAHPWHQGAPKTPCAPLAGGCPSVCCNGITWCLLGCSAELSLGTE